MSSASLRCGGAALVGVLTLSGAIAAPASAAPADTPAQPSGIPTDTVRTEIRKASLAVLPKLSLLDLPELGGSLGATGYAGRDLLVDLAPDLSDRDLAFTLQRLEGEAWLDVSTGTTSGATERVTLANLPAGTYRVSVPEQFGLDTFTSDPYAHAPRSLSADIAFDRASTTTTADVDPDPAAGSSYSFSLEKLVNGTWTSVSTQTTNAPAGGFRFDDLGTGTYRIVVPDQVDAIGAVSNQIDVISQADVDAAAAADRRAKEAVAVRAATARQNRPQVQAPAARASAAPAAPADAAPAPTGGVVGAAMAQVGKAYRLGANGPGAFDCSGLTSYAYRAAGKSIPRTAASQYAAAAKVSNPQPGDLVFFLRNGAQHVGVYIGGGRMVHAANPGRGVEVSSFGSGWYARSFTGYGRF